MLPDPATDPRRDQTALVVAATGVIGPVPLPQLDDEIIEVQTWDVVRVAPEVIRAFEAGPEGLELLAVGSDRPEGGDGVMAKDWWPE